MQTNVSVHAYNQQIAFKGLSAFALLYQNSNWRENEGQRPVSKKASRDMMDTRVATLPTTG
ncbi:hypothetical protein [Mucilaginibacter sp.]